MASPSYELFSSSHQSLCEPLTSTRSIPTSTHPPPFSFNQWINDNQHLLQPPVGNKMIHSQGCQFKIMIVGGPNTRTDYHINRGEEWFYMVKGNMTLKIVDGGIFRDVIIREGEAYLLGATIPHSPQRKANTIGLVIERERLSGELDGLRWYCRQCYHVIYEEWFQCQDLGSQLAVKIREYYSNTAMRTCRHCGIVDERPGEAHTEIDEKQAPHAKELSVLPFLSSPLPCVNPSTHPSPYHLQSWITSHLDELKPPVGNKMIHSKGCQFKIMIVGGPNQRTDYHVDAGEEWFYQLKGSMTLKVVNGGRFEDLTINEGDCFLLPGNIPHSPQRRENTIGLVVERERLASEMDGLIWYCRNPTCQQILVQHTFQCQDLGSQLVTLINDYYSDASIDKRTCRHCGTVDERLTSK